MEKYTSPFFGTEGLTSTSANHVANIAKEYYESLETELAATNFVKEEISVVGSLDKTETNKATPDIMNVIDDYITEIAAAKSLIAWLREAIKTKTRYSKELDTYRSEEYCNLEYPKSPYVRSHEEILESWDIKDRERYLSLEAECAVLGQYIHPKGAYAKAKKRLFEKVVKPVETTLQGRDTIITYFTPVVEKEEVEKKFFALQQRHRSAQAELNGFKTRLEKEEKEERDRVSRDYMKALDAYKAESNRLIEADKLYVEEERKKIESLKIVIPPHHKAMYNLLMTQGK